eukprot:3176680-Prymnesium_polylepis.1
MGLAGAPDGWGAMGLAGLGRWAWRLPPRLPAVGLAPPLPCGRARVAVAQARAPARQGGLFGNQAAGRRVALVATHTPQGRQAAEAALLGPHADALVAPRRRLASPSWLSRRSVQSSRAERRTALARPPGDACARAQRARERRAPERSHTAGWGG